MIFYFHLKQHINLKDGWLHYQIRPEYVSEYTEEYLIYTDVNVEFKIVMDVQIVPGCLTTMKDVKSVVRQFLKSTKCISYHEAIYSTHSEMILKDIFEVTCSWAI